MTEEAIIKEEPFWLEPYNQDIYSRGLHIPDQAHLPNVDNFLEKIALEHPELLSNNDRHDKDKK